MTKGSCVQSLVSINYPSGISIPKGETGEIVETSGPSVVCVKWKNGKATWVSIIEIKELPDHLLATETDA